MAALRLIGVKNRFVNPGDFEVAGGNICAIVGPSGAGKTSLLRIIAGLDPHEGRVLIDEAEVQGLAPHRRAIGFVSQDLHLFPHLTLEGNLWLAMQRAKLNHVQKQQRAESLVQLLRITHLCGRKPDTFSGGEKQRAALARVLASSPRLLLLDEPFSKLDFRTARYLRSEFKQLQEKVGLTTILVTHDLEEAGELARILWVMRDGCLSPSSQSFSPGQEGRSPADSFLEAPNVLACQPLKVLENGLVEAKWAGGILLIPDEGQPFSRIAVGCREIELGLTPPQGPQINRFVGSVERVENGDGAIQIALDVNGVIVRVETPRDKWDQLDLVQGQKVHGFIRLKALQAC